MAWIAQRLQNISDNWFSYVKCYYLEEYYLSKVKKRQSNPFEWRIMINLYLNESKICFVYLACINYCKDREPDNLTLRDGNLH